MEQIKGDSLLSRRWGEGKGQHQGRNEIIRFGAVIRLQCSPFQRNKSYFVYCIFTLRYTPASPWREQTRGTFTVKLYQLFSRVTFVLLSGDTFSGWFRPGIRLSPRMYRWIRYRFQLRVASTWVLSESRVGNVERDDQVSNSNPTIKTYIFVHDCSI